MSCAGSAWQYRARLLRASCGRRRSVRKSSWHRSGPEGYAGNFIGTQRMSRAAAAAFGCTPEHVTACGTCSTIGCAGGVADLLIQRLDTVGEHPPALDLTASQHCAASGRSSTIRCDSGTSFTTLSCAHSDRTGEVSFLPRNDFNAPAGAVSATGGGQSTNQVYPAAYTTLQMMRRC